MAVSKMVLSDNIEVVYSSDLENSVETDLAGGPCRLLFVSLTGGGAAQHLKLYDDVNPTLSSSVPDEIVNLVTGKSLALVVHPPSGLYFENGLSAACVQEAGTGGTTAPTSSVVAFFVIKKEV